MAHIFLGPTIKMKEVVTKSPKGVIASQDDLHTLVSSNTRAKKKGLRGKEIQNIVDEPILPIKRRGRSRVSGWGGYVSRTTKDTTTSSRKADSITSLRGKHKSNSQQTQKGPQPSKFMPHNFVSSRPQAFPLLLFLLIS